MVTKSKILSWPILTGKTAVLGYLLAGNPNLTSVLTSDLIRPGFGVKGHETENFELADFEGKNGYPRVFWGRESESDFSFDL
jgi:hypothetical protein